MNVSLTEDRKHLILRNLTSNEIDQLRLFFTKEPPQNWILKNKTPCGAYKTEFFNRFGLLPFGLWMELIECCKTYGFNLIFEPGVEQLLLDTQLTLDTFKYYVDNLFSNAIDEKGNRVAPMGYQIEGVFKLVKFRRSSVEVTTSGGKTLMSYVLFKFLRDIKHIKRCLYIVPNVNLATQSLEKYNRYENWIGGEHSFKAAYLAGKLKKAEREAINTCDILFGTYQSLKEKKADFFKDFDTVIVDEAHHLANGKSIKNIIEKCHSMQYCFGVTGTFPRNDYMKFNIESYTGPLVYKMTSFQLINIEKFATPIYIISDILDYAPEADKEVFYMGRMMKAKNDVSEGNRLLKQEQNYSMKNGQRLRYICDLANRCKHNTLVLFNDVNVNKYGRKIYDYLKENSEKNVYYADGSTDTASRDYYKQQMEEDLSGNTIIVGSTGCFSEGIDVGNLWTIILANSVKSEFIVRQFIGRGMRMFEGKDKVVIFDIVDNFVYGSDKWKKTNYLMKHYKERKKIYQEQGFPLFERNVKFEQQTNLIS